MADMPVIKLPVPLVIPAQEELSFDDGWLLELILTTEGAPRQQALRGVIRPHDPKSDTLWPAAEKDNKIDIEDVWAEAKRCARFAEAMAGLVTVANLYVQERALLAAISDAAEKSADTADVERTLKELHAVMGVAE